MFSKKQLEEMTVEDLKLAARDLAIANYSTMVKADLVTAILAAQTPEKAEKLNRKRKEGEIADKDGKVASNFSGTAIGEKARENISKMMQSKIDNVNAPIFSDNIYAQADLVEDV